MGIRRECGGQGEGGCKVAENMTAKQRTGQAAMTEKGVRESPCKKAGKWQGLKRKGGVPSTPMTEISEGTVGPK